MMYKGRRTMIQRMQRGMLFVLLLAIMTSLAYAAAPTAAVDAAESQTPITMRGSWSFTADADIDSIAGMWFAANDNKGKHGIALAWVPENSAWWPTWRLMLASETGLLPLNTPHTYTVPGWANSAAVDLGTSKPIPGHVYEPMISYDPQNGALSVSLTDLTTGERLRADSFSMPKLAGPFTLASGQLVEAGQPSSKTVAVSNLSTSAHYVPAGTIWQVGVYEGDALITFSSINTNDKAFLQLKVAGPAPRGEYRVFQSYDGVKKELPIKPQVNGLVALPVASMPLGKSQLILEYSEQGQVTFADTLNLTVGLLDVRFGKVTVNRDAQKLYSSMLINSKGPLTGVNAVVEATITEMIWDPVKRNYREEVYKKETLTLARDLTVPGGDQVELPISITLPDRPNFWKVNFQPVISPNITVASFVKPVMFNTYMPAAPIGKDEPYTIAVLPDTQYLSGYNPVILNRMSQWLLEKADEKNIGLMLHVGDITDRNSTDQWENAQAAISQLDGLIPYAMAVGNHDMSPPGVAGSVAHRGQSQIKSYFPPNVFVGLQGSFPEDRVDNTYHTFNVGGVDYLVLALEFCPPDEVLEWANKIVESFPNHKAILITHAYTQSNGLRLPQGKSTTYPLGQDKTTTMNDGQGMWDKFVRKHENMFMVISGHINGVGIPWNIAKGDKGNRVYEFLIDYQDKTDGWLVTLEFSRDNKISVNSYSPYLDKNKTDINSHGYTNRFQLDLETGRITYRF